MNQLLLGALTVASLVVALFFLRFYRLAADRFFLLFAIAFALLGVQWLVGGVLDPDQESRAWFYLLRLAAFSLIIAAIIDKNRRPD